MTICERMFEIMEHKCITAYVLCQKTGLSNSTLSNWKTRNTDPPARFIVPICEVLNCSPNYLLTGTDKSAGINSRQDAIYAGYAPAPSQEPQNWSIRHRMDYLLGGLLATEEDMLDAVGVSPGSEEAAAIAKGEFSASLVAPLCKFFGCSMEFLLTGQETKKAPTPGISENGREMLALYEKLPEREQVLLLGRLQEMTAPLLGEVKKRDQAETASSGGRAG